MAGSSTRRKADTKAIQQEIKQEAEDLARDMAELKKKLVAKNGKDIMASVGERRSEEPRSGRARTARARTTRAVARTADGRLQWTKWEGDGKDKQRTEALRRAPHDPAFIRDTKVAEAENRKLAAKKKYSWFLFHKPSGCLASTIDQMPQPRLLPNDIPDRPAHVPTARTAASARSGTVRSGTARSSNVGGDDAIAEAESVGYDRESEGAIGDRDEGEGAERVEDEGSDAKSVKNQLATSKRLHNTNPVGSHKRHPIVILDRFGNPIVGRSKKKRQESMIRQKPPSAADFSTVATDQFRVRSRRAKLREDWRQDSMLGIDEDKALGSDMGGDRTSRTGVSLGGSAAGAESVRPVSQRSELEGSSRGGGGTARSGTGSSKSRTHQPEPPGSTRPRTARSEAGERLPASQRSATAKGDRPVSQRSGQPLSQRSSPNKGNDSGNEDGDGGVDYADNASVAVGEATEAARERGKSRTMDASEKRLSTLLTKERNPTLYTFIHDPILQSHVSFPQLPVTSLLETNVSGLMLFTDDPMLRDALVDKRHFNKPVDKVYLVEVYGKYYHGDKKLLRLRAPHKYGTDGKKHPLFQEDGEGDDEREETDRHNEETVRDPEDDTDEDDEEIEMFKELQGNKKHANINDVTNAANSTLKYKALETRMTGQAKVAVLQRRMLTRSEPDYGKYPLTKDWVTVLQICITDDFANRFRIQCNEAGVRIRTVHRERLGVLFMSGMKRGGCRYLTNTEIVQMYNSTLPVEKFDQVTVPAATLKRDRLPKIAAAVDIELYKGSHVFPYPHRWVANSIAERVGDDCTPEEICAYVIKFRCHWLLRGPGRELGYFYFVVNKPPGVSGAYPQYDQNKGTPIPGHLENGKEGTSIYSILENKYPQVPQVVKLEPDDSGLALFTDDPLLSEALRSDARLHRSVGGVAISYMVCVECFDGSPHVTDKHLKVMRSAAPVPADKAADHMDVGRPATVTLTSEDSPHIQAFLDNEWPAAHTQNTNTGLRAHWLRVVVYDGRRRYVRRLCTKAGLHVIHCVRTHFGHIHMSALAPGKARTFMQAEVDEAYEMLGLDPTAKPEILVPGDETGQASVAFGEEMAREAEERRKKRRAEQEELMKKFDLMQEKYEQKRKDIANMEIERVRAQQRALEAEDLRLKAEEGLKLQLEIKKMKAMEEAEKARKEVEMEYEEAKIVATKKKMAMQKEAMRKQAEEARARIEKERVDLIARTAFAEKWLGDWLTKKSIDEVPTPRQGSVYVEGTLSLDVPYDADNFEAVQKDFVLESIALSSDRALEHIRIVDVREGSTIVDWKIDHVQDLAMAKLIAERMDKYVPNNLFCPALGLATVVTPAKVVSQIRPELGEFETEALAKTVKDIIHAHRQKIKHDIEWKKMCELVKSKQAKGEVPSPRMGDLFVDGMMQFPLAFNGGFMEQFGSEFTDSVAACGKVAKNLVRIVSAIDAEELAAKERAAAKGGDGDVGKAGEAGGENVENEEGEEGQPFELLSPTEEARRAEVGKAFAGNATVIKYSIRVEGATSIDEAETICFELNKSLYDGKFDETLGWVRHLDKNCTATEIQPARPRVVSDEAHFTFKDDHEVGVVQRAMVHLQARDKEWEEKKKDKAAKDAEKRRGGTITEEEKQAAIEKGKQRLANTIEETKKKREEAMKPKLTEEEKVAMMADMDTPDREKVQERHERLKEKKRADQREKTIQDVKNAAL